MNTSGSALTYAQIDSISTNLKSYSTNMEAILNEIKTLFAKVGTDSVWSGTSAQAAKQDFDRLSAKFPEFSQAVNECASYLKTVVANYQAADRQVISEKEVTE